MPIIPWLNSELRVYPWLTSYPSTLAVTTIFTTTDLRATSGLSLPSSRSRLHFPILHHQITSRHYLLPVRCIHLTVIVIQTFVTCSFIPSQVIIKGFIATDHITCLSKFTFIFKIIKVIWHICKFSPWLLFLFWSNKMFFTNLWYYFIKQCFQ